MRVTIVILIASLCLIASVYAAEKRVWSDKDGDFLIEGYLDKAVDNKIQIKSPDGKIHEFYKALLSPEDQHFVNECEARKDKKRTYPIKLTIDRENTVYRERLEDEERSKLTWVVTYNGKKVLSRNAAGEFQYTYFRKSPGAYTIHVEKYGIGKGKERVSNLIAYFISD